MDVVHVVDGEAISADAVHRAVELALKYCPVSAMLAAGTVEIHHAYRIVAPTARRPPRSASSAAPNAAAEALVS